MKVIKKTMIGCLAILTSSPTIAAEIDFGAKVRVRAEHVEAALGRAKGKTGNWVSQQTRLETKAKNDEGLSAFLQLQDVRTWGGEDQSFPPPSVTGTGTSASAKGLDFHQAYFTVNSFGMEDLKLKAGRQEIVFDDARLVGNIGWIQNAQSFDALRLSYKGTGFDLDVVGAQVLADDTHPVLKPYTTAHDQDSYFTAVHSSFKVGGGVVNPFVYTVSNPTRLKPGTDSDGNPNTVSIDSLQTVGVFVKQTFGDTKLTFHGGSQSGNVSPTISHSAYFAALAVAQKIVGSQVSLHYDVYSGDKDKTDNQSNAFNALYPTNHAYFGFIDNFLFTPNAGVTDTQLRYGTKIGEKAKVGVHLHKFGTSPGSIDPGQDAGSEVDVTLKIKARKGLGYQFGLSKFTGAGSTNYGSTGNTTLDSTWAYVQTAVSF